MSIERLTRSERTRRLANRLVPSASLPSERHLSRNRSDANCSLSVVDHQNGRQEPVLPRAFSYIASMRIPLRSRAI